MDFFISSAYANTGGQAGSDPMGGLLLFVGMIVIFYFLLIRPQQKRAKQHREMVTALGKGDEVVTSGGILGKITNVGDQNLTVEIADGVSILVQRHAVHMILPKGSIKAAAKEES